MLLVAGEKPAFACRGRKIEMPDQLPFPAPGEEPLRVCRLPVHHMSNFANEHKSSNLS